MKLTDESKNMRKQLIKNECKSILMNINELFISDITVIDICIFEF